MLELALNAASDEIFMHLLNYFEICKIFKVLETKRFLNIYLFRILTRMDFMFSA